MLKRIIVGSNNNLERTKRVKKTKIVNNWERANNKQAKGMKVFNKKQDKEMAKTKKRFNV